jgi:RNA polymerase sigma-54 factor
MVSLQPRLNLKVAQRQILTPGLVQMVSVLALNKLELRDMIQAEMVENPVLEELDESIPVLDEVARREEERALKTEDAEVAKEKNDAFEEIDFGSFFRDYLDPGYRSPETESVERPSFENFLSRPRTLTDHLIWQLGAMVVSPEVRDAAELVIGNLDEDGYLTASEDELLAAMLAVPDACGPAPSAPPEALAQAEIPDAPMASAEAGSEASLRLMSARANLKEAVEIVRQLDPAGVGARDMRECLLAQIKYHQTCQERQNGRKSPNGATDEVLRDAGVIVDQHLKLVQNKQVKEIAKAMNRPLEAVQAALDFIRTLDPRPGQRYNQAEPVAAQSDLSPPAAAGRFGKGRSQLRQREVQIGDSAHQEHRTAQADDPEGLLRHHRSSARISRLGHRPAQADDDQGGGRRNRRAPVHRQPGGGQQVRPHCSGRV